MNRIFSLSFTFKPELPRVARRSVENVLMHSPLSLSQRNKVALAVSELTANMIRHSNPKPEKVDIECSWCDQHFNLKLRDNGSVYTASHPLDTLESLLESEPDCSGYGMALLENQFDYFNHSLTPAGWNQWLLRLYLEQLQTRYRILIVDDDAIQLQMLQMYLDPHESITFSSAIEAVDWLKHEQPDLIISDICMPDMDGLRFRERIREFKHLQLTPFIFITGDSDEGLARQATDNDIDDFVLKPVTKSQVSHITERVMQRSQGLLSRARAMIDQELRHHLRKIPSEEIIPGYRVQTLSRSATLGGGDYWLFEASEKSVSHLVLGDVMGHDISSCFMAGRQQGVIQTLFETTTNSHSSLSQSQAFLTGFSHWLDKRHPDILTTLQLFSFSHDSILFQNAGAIPPWIIHTDGTCASVPHTGPLPGMGGMTTDQPFEIVLNPGEQLLIFSDGLIEVDSRSHIQTERIINLLEMIRDMSLENSGSLIDGLQEAVNCYPVNDDISIILIKKQ
ncbi:response regulator [Oceanospirillum sediminis]|uniref:Response regulator n=1 Tax=Oceanospirillum sediminis TaxID=2760088 RepID=A0A839IUW8_9GAMM|nr:response regulator [Oceanospirillum sediminis]MBB1488748.1 response regulator [Oceanospirillum sediminis]